jgi:hypothetical protein
MSANPPIEMSPGLYEGQNMPMPALLAATLIGQATIPIPSMLDFIAKCTGSSPEEVLSVQGRLTELGLLRLEEGELIVSGLHDDAMRIAVAANVHIGDRAIPRAQFQGKINEWRAAMTPPHSERQAGYGCLTPTFLGFLYTIVKRSLSAKRL